MNKYLKRNILFFTIILLIFIAIGIFNYKIDPYFFLTKRFNDKLIVTPRKYLYTNLKFKKNQDSDTMLIGSSEAADLLGLQYFLEIPVIYTAPIDSIPDYLEIYLKLNPKTKNIILSTSINYIYKKNYINIKKYKTTKLTLKEILDVFFSTETTIASINKLKRIQANKKNTKTNTISKRYFCTTPNYQFKFEHNHNHIAEKQDLIYQSIEKIIKLLEENDINYTFVIPPTNAIFLTATYQDKELKSAIEDFKRFLASKVPYYYDFAIINKYTEIDPQSKDNYVWRDYDHFSGNLGVKVFRVLRKEKDIDESLFKLVTKDNIDEIIKEENELIKKHIEKNKETVEFYNKEINKRNSKRSINLKEPICKDLDFLPENLRKEDDYMEKRKDIYLYYYSYPKSKK